MSLLSDALDAVEQEGMPIEQAPEKTGTAGSILEMLSLMTSLPGKTLYSGLLGAAGGLQKGETLSGGLKGMLDPYQTGGKDFLEYGDYIQKLGLPETAINPYLGAMADAIGLVGLDPLTYLGGLPKAGAASFLGKSRQLGKLVTKGAPKAEKAPAPLRAGYESVGGGKPPMPSRIPGERPQRGMTSDFAPHEDPSMLGLEGGLPRDLTAVGRLTREAAEFPSPSTWEQMLESGFTQPPPGIPMPPSSLRAARGEVIPYSAPSVPVGMTYDRAARSAIESSMRPVGLPTLPKALPPGREPLALGGRLFGETKELSSKPIPLPASTIHPEAKKIFDQIPVPATETAKATTKTLPFWKRPPAELKLENLLSAAKGEKGKVIVGKPGSSHTIVLPGTIKSAQVRAQKIGFSDPSGKVFFNLNDLEAAGADAALAYLRKAIKQGYVLDKAGYEYVKKHAKVGA